MIDLTVDAAAKESSVQAATPVGAVFWHAGAPRCGAVAAAPWFVLVICLQEGATNVYKACESSAAHVCVLLVELAASMPLSMAHVIAPHSKPWLCQLRLDGLRKHHRSTDDEMC